MKPDRVLLATRSDGKLRELNEIFRDFGIDAIDLRTAGIAESSAEDSLETEGTFEGNALAKARYFYDRSGGLPTFADDSGLRVDVLGGAPGVLSRRWSGRADLSGAALDAANNSKLAAAMDKARDTHGPRFTDTGRYVCVAVFKDAAGEVFRRGEIEGRVLREPQGSGGFGYDSYFEAPDLGGTFAEARLEHTARVSHRSRAFRALLSALRAQGRL